MHGTSQTIPRSWLAFDLSVLRRMNFASVALPFIDKPALGAYLKRCDVRVAANDPLQSVWAKGFAQIANSTEQLTADDVNTVLEDAYVPGYKLANPALSNWFGEADSWWFDNVRRRIERLATPYTRAIASSIAMQVGDYVLSFKEETRELRQPLSNVFRRLWSIHPEPFNTRQSNSCHNETVNDFVSQTRSIDVMFLRLPPAHTQGIRAFLGRSAWREEWLRGGNDFWVEFERNMAGQLGVGTETKSQYLHLLEDTLRRASHIKTWAIAHVETGFIQTQDIVDTIGRIRSVDTIYTKDLSELTGTKAVIITA
jgi:hypothetical protein